MIDLLQPTAWNRWTDENAAFEGWLDCLTFIIFKSNVSTDKAQLLYTQRLTSSTSLPLYLYVLFGLICF